MKSKIIKLTGTKITSNTLQSLIGKKIMISINETNAPTPYNNPFESKPVKIYYMISTEAHQWGAGWSIDEAIKRAGINDNTPIALLLIVSSYFILESEDPARLPYIDEDGYTCHFPEHARRLRFKGTLKEFREWLKTSNLQA